MGTVVRRPNRITNEEPHCLQEHACDQQSSTVSSNRILKLIIQHAKYIVKSYKILEKIIESL